MAKSLRKTKKTLKKSKNGKKGGGCGCGISGGKKQRKTRSKKQVRGGSSNLQNLPIRYYYQLNAEINNPQDPSFIGNSIKQILGGKSKKNKKNKSRKNKKVTKGGMIGSVLNGTQMNVVTDFGTSMGSNTAYNMQNVSSNTTVDMTKQPAGNINNEHTHPLV